MKRCESCLARIARNTMPENRLPNKAERAAMAAWSNECTCDPLQRHYVGRREWQDILPPREDHSCPSPDPGRFTDESTGLWSRCIRAMEDAA